MTAEEIIEQRKNKFLKIGRSKGFISNPENLSSLQIKNNTIEKFFHRHKNRILYLAGILFLLATLSILIL